MRNQIFNNLSEAINNCLFQLKTFGVVVNTDKWQGIRNTENMLELYTISLIANLPSTRTELLEQTKADMPWAENHFLERVCGEPLNPGTQYKNWPHYKNHNFNDTNFRNVGEKFTHTYMERYWPTRAGDMLLHKDADDHARRIPGIRYEYGDLKDVIDLLARDPFTRQAYLPVWFPEDTGVKHGGRVPCTLGYLFMRRGNKLHITYYLRSCDALRHFRNDVYMTARLAQWVLGELSSSDKWDPVTLGTLTMHIGSFHVFEKEKNLI